VRLENRRASGQPFGRKQEFYLCSALSERGFSGGSGKPRLFPVLKSFVPAEGSDLSVERGKGGNVATGFAFSLSESRKKHRDYYLKCFLPGDESKGMRVPVRCGGGAEISGRLTGGGKCRFVLSALCRLNL
jgi:hypothetical protein